jgi:hypothetical protein
MTAVASAVPMQVKMMLGMLNAYEYMLISALSVPNA